MDFTAIDFETANDEVTSACALGLTLVKQGRIVEQRSWLIRPSKMLFLPFNTLIHGITEEDVVDAPEFGDLWPEIKPYMDGRFMVAHNSDFDFTVLCRLLDLYGYQYPQVAYACTRVIAKRTWPDLSAYRLNTVADFLGLRFQHHDAGDDAYAAAEIVRKALRHHELEDVRKLTEKLEILNGSISPGRHSLMRKRMKRTHDDMLDPGHPFYNQNLAFTGILKSMSRRDAKQKVVDVGGFCTSAVREATDFLVRGEFNGRYNGGISNKLKKAEEMKEQGHPISVITEEEFLGSF